MSIGNIKDYTPNFKFIIPSFDIATWHDYIEENFRNIDALFYNLFGINNYSGTWKNTTSYTAGQVLFVGEDKDLEGNDTDYTGRLVKVLIDHTTDNSDYFNVYYNLHPEYYELFADASTAQYYAQIAQNNANSTAEMKVYVENYLRYTEDLRNETQILTNDAEYYKNLAEERARDAKTSADNAQVSAINANDYLNLTQETYYNAVNEVNSAKSEAIIQIDDNANQKIAEFDNLATQNTQTATNLLENTQIAAQNAQNYANEAWGKISNVGDIFYSLRLDDELNGAVVCNGNYYELEDFTGTHSIKNLLEQNKLPYVSLNEYENTLNTYGSVRCFGYDVGGTQFRVPKLDDVYIKAGIAELPNEFNVESLPNITGAFHHNDLFSGTATASGAFGTTVAPNGSYVGALQDTRTTARWDFDASRSSSTYKTGAKVNPDNVRYRAFVQLANAATENAVISATSAISKLADASYKSKDETYSGQKTFEKTVTSKGNFYSLTNLPYTSNPSETIYRGLLVRDPNNNTWASLQGVQYASGTNAVQMTVKGKSGTLRRMYVQETSEGVATYNYGQTVGTNYIRIPRGAGTYVQYCWGSGSKASGNSFTFPVAFNSAPIVIAVIGPESGGSTINAITSSVTTTSFKVIHNAPAGNLNKNVSYIAIGTADM